MKRYCTPGIVALTLSATSLAAEEPIPFADWIESLNGTRIIAEAAIGHNGSDGLVIAKLGTGYLHPAVTALPLAQTKALEDCKINQFMGVKADTCFATISAEVDMSGGLAKFFVYELENLRVGE